MKTNCGLYPVLPDGNVADSSGWTDFHEAAIDRASRTQLTLAGSFEDLLRLRPSLTSSAALLCRRDCNIWSRSGGHATA